MKSIERRSFLVGAALVACQRGKEDPARVAEPSKPSERAHDVERRDIETRPLGNTGERVSCVGIGGYHLGVPSESEALDIVHRAIDAGITFIDNCWDYHEGESERRVGKALADGKRDKVFLMTKIDGRTYDSARKQIDQSLERLRTDHVDLMQIHEVIRTRDPAWVFENGGAAKALLEAKQAGKVRYVGFTGHKSPAIHLAMLKEADARGFRFDAVQLPLNVMDPHYDSFETHVLPVLLEKRIGVLGMKPLASGDILETGLVGAEDCLRYALSLPTSVIITGCDSRAVLDQAIRVARAFEPLTREQRDALLARTKDAGKKGKHEGFKTTARFDATERNPHWLTTDET